jgi:hypothetical protein
MKGGTIEEKAQAQGEKTKSRIYTLVPNIQLEDNLRHISIASE